MRKTIFTGAAAAALLGAAPAAAQSSFMADVIGQAVAGYGSGQPTECYNGKWATSAQDDAHYQPFADPAFRMYLDAAAQGADFTSAFDGSRSARHWRLDGVEGGANGDFTAIHDPWASKVARIEQVNFTLGNWHVHSRAVWKAYDAGGNLLGMYDAYMRRSGKGSTLLWLDLYSADAMDKAKPMTAFCEVPGDVEAWQKAMAERAAAKAAKRAAKEAARAAQQQQ